MPTYPRNIRQPFGRKFERDFVEKNLSIIGQENPAQQENWKMAHGRYLAGLGVVNPPDGTQRSYRDAATTELETVDDVVGSGIFDDPMARRPTVHVEMGIFADRPSIPGFIARNPPFTVSEVEDVNGARVVEVPAGGMAYVEDAGHLIGPSPQRRRMRRPPTLARQVPSMSTVDATLTPAPLGAYYPLGEDPVPEPSGIPVAYAIGYGVIAGLAFAMFFGATKGFAR